MSERNGKNTLVGVIDIGSSKIVCLIARRENGGQLKVLGIGHQASFGL